jgi:hypothetical protein
MFGQPEEVVLTTGFRPAKDSTATVIKNIPISCIGLKEGTPEYATAEKSSSEKAAKFASEHPGLGIKKEEPTDTVYPFCIRMKRVRSITLLMKELHI